MKASNSIVPLGQGNPQNAALRVKVPRPLLDDLLEEPEPEPEPDPLLVGPALPPPPEPPPEPPPVAVMGAVAPRLLTAEAAVELMHSVLVPGWMTVGAA